MGAVIDNPNAPVKPRGTFAAFLRLIVERRNHRGWWAYLLFASAYSFVLLWFLADIGAQNLSVVLNVWPLLIPLALVIVQWARPTLVGWALISLPGTAYALTGLATLPADWHRLAAVEKLGASLFLLFVSSITAFVAWATFPRPVQRTRDD